MSKNVIIGLVSTLVVLAFVGILAYSSMSGTKYRVNVCINYNGRTECRTASADSREHAQRAAQSNACGLLASGVTETMQCEHLDPASVKWLDSK
jgi:hypothetical protein